MLKDNEICCEAMKIRVETSPYRAEQKTHIYYDQICRSYHLIFHRNDWDILRYCPWCGKKLPEELDPWDTIMDEYGEDYVKYKGDPGYKELTREQMREFTTDEWWKKRGL